MKRAQQEFEAFYAQARDGCLRAVAVSTSDTHLAEELVAEAFSRAWARWSSVRAHPCPEAWVVRTALNLRVSWWRRRRREVACTDDLRAPAGVRATSPQAAAVEEVGSRIDLVALLASLPERQRQVLALRFVLDLDTRATADALGIAEGTVKAHLHRGTTSLRVLLEQPPPAAPGPRGLPAIPHAVPSPA